MVVLSAAALRTRTRMNEKTTTEVRLPANSTRVLSPERTYMKKGREDEKRANQRTRQSFVEDCLVGSLLNESEKMGYII
jgi:hypothetical protein